jgi:hypothetical protein
MQLNQMLLATAAVHDDPLRRLSEVVANVGIPDEDYDDGNTPLAASIDAAAAQLAPNSLGSMNLAVLHKPRNNRGQWAELAEGDELRVTPGVGKCLRIRCAVPTPFQGSDVRVSLEPSFPDERAPFQLDDVHVRPSQDGLLHTGEFDIRLYILSHTHPFRFHVQIHTRQGRRFSDRTVSLTSRNNGKSKKQQAAAAALHSAHTLQRVKFEPPQSGQQQQQQQQSTSSSNTTPTSFSVATPIFVPSSASTPSYMSNNAASISRPIFTSTYFSAQSPQPSPPTSPTRSAATLIGTPRTASLAFAPLPQTATTIDHQHLPSMIPLGEMPNVKKQVQQRLFQNSAFFFADLFFFSRVTFERSHLFAENQTVIATTTTTNDTNVAFVGTTSVFDAMAGRIVRLRHFALTVAAAAVSPSTFATTTTATLSIAIATTSPDGTRS